MNKSNLIFISLIVLVAAIGTGIYLQQQPSQEILLQEQPIPTTDTKPPKIPIVHYPVTAKVQSETKPPLDSVVPEENSVPRPLPLPVPLPNIQNSDASIKKVLQSITESSNLGAEFLRLLILDHFIPRVVVTIDNLPGKKLPQAHLPLKNPQGRFLTSGTAEVPQTSQKNHRRYEPYINILENFDTEFVIEIYHHYYPLFQTAYKQLGYKNAYFNDRLIQVLDHLIETPNPIEPLALKQPVVLYTYAAPTLEALSSGQKILLRMGPENRQRVLTILKKYRQKLIK